MNKMEKMAKSKRVKMIRVGDQIALYSRWFTDRYDLVIANNKKWTIANIARNHIVIERR